MIGTESEFRTERGLFKGLENNPEDLKRVFELVLVVLVLNEVFDFNIVFLFLFFLLADKCIHTSFAVFWSLLSFTRVSLIAFNILKYPFIIIFANIFFLFIYEKKNIKWY